MYSIEDIENMCAFDTNKLSYIELDLKYNQLNEALLCISNDKKSSFSNDIKTLKYAINILLSAIKKINSLLDYYDKIGKGRKV